MSEHTSPIPEDLEPCPAGRYFPPAPEDADCPCAQALAAIQALLSAQNALLLDLLGALNAQTAAILARHTQNSEL